MERERRRRPADYRDDYQDNYREDYRDERRDEEPRSRRSSRRKPSLGSMLSNTLLYILLVLGISAILAVVGWTMADDVLALNKPETTSVISVTDVNDFDGVVNQLKAGGIIRYKGLFKLFCSVTHGESKIALGTYELNTDMDYRAILSNLGSSSASRMTTTVTIPEGYNVRQIFQLLDEKGVSTVPELEDMAANHFYNFTFLWDIPMGDPNRLEGYLFPDTYEFYMGEDPKYVINKMLCNFDAKLTDAMREEIWAKGTGINQIITIASMIEKETDGSDRALVSSVIQNRLNHPYGETVGLLQIDATIQYVLPEGRLVTEEDYSTVDSPYNTYMYKGLPPGPIGCPGMQSIYAAIHPESSNYYFYGLGDDGVHHYFNTYSEFQNFLHS